MHPRSRGSVPAEAGTDRANVAKMSPRISKAPFPHRSRPLASVFLSSGSQRAMTRSRGQISSKASWTKCASPVSASMRCTRFRNSLPVMARSGSSLVTSPEALRLT